MTRKIPYYNLEIMQPTGETLDLVEDAISVQAARSFNNLGNATFVLPSHYPRTWFQYDTRFNLYRVGRDRKPHLFGGTMWFLRKIRFLRDEQRYEIEAVDSLSILQKRLVAYTAETPYADKTLEEFALVSPTTAFQLDNMMRQYVRENLGPDALDATRTISIITIEPDLNLGPYGEKEASWARLDSVIADLANQSATKGTPLFYDFIAQTDGTFMFKVWSTVRGIDRGTTSGRPLEFDDESGVLVDVVEEDDYSEYGNYCYVLGYDRGPSQIVVERFDSARYLLGPLARTEFTYTGSDSDVDSVLEDAGDAAIRGQRGLRRVSAKLSAAATLDYGTDFAYGDKVIARVGGRRYDAQFDAVSVSWAEARESLDLRLNGSEDI